MKQNVIEVTYPGEHTFSYVIETPKSVSSEDLVERVFAEWNGGSGQECELFRQHRCRSMCSNDIVRVNGVYFQCLPIGWNEVSHDYVVQLERDVHAHPLCSNPDGGPWVALDRVMWDRRSKRTVVA